MFAPGSALSPLRWPVFRAIWIANLASSLGSLIEATAAAWVMTELTSSHLLVALVQASVTIPVLALALLAGVIADQYDRRIVMLLSTLAMLVLSSVLAVLAWIGALSPASLLFFTLAIGAGYAINGPAWQASVRLMVPREDLPQAISLNAVSYNVARSLGPAIGGVLLSLAGPSTAFTVNAVSYLGLIWILLRWRPEVAPRPRHPMLPAIASGVRFAASSSPVRRVLVRSTAFGAGIIAVQALLPLVAKEQLRSGEMGFGLIFGSFGVGAVISAMWIARARRRFGPEAVVAGASLIAAFATALLALAPTVPVAMAAAFLAGSGHVSALTSLNVAIQMRSPDELLGRVLSIYQAMIFGGMALGAAAWGALSDLAGTSAALLAAAAWLLVSLGVMRVFAPMPKIGEGIAKPAA
ncbi:MAG: MFS transporter [Candidatus Andeanibacterium colombiense]|uniref:MFS transporter n=1 Tax=Candidatus Andeanibacterium colombiense TaxID=3121345 RepID=A0AAJ6BN99_9SPHN|nr:MAG: MFS transporter [Sphingomonadaceae bacterium]